MDYDTFTRRANLGIYRQEDKFWVCDVRQNLEKPIGEFYRKLKPTQVCYMRGKDEEIYFVKPKKDGTPSKTKVSINGPTNYQEPFKIFEAEDDCRDYFIEAMKKVFLDINARYDEFRDKCTRVLGDILEDMKDVSKTSL